MEDNNMDLGVALARNILNSPFVSMNSDGSETKISENYLYFIHLQRNPNPNFPPFTGLASLFEKAITHSTNQEEEIWRQEYLLKYEQYFSRIELFHQLLMFEATVRQLIHSHLKKSVQQEELDKKGLISERDNLIKTTISFLRYAVNKEHNAGIEPNFPINQFNQMIDRVMSIFVKPLIVFRDGICHSNIRAYVKGLRTNSPSVGSESDDSIEGRAIAIFENIDAHLFYILSQNLNLLRSICYMWLVEYQENNLIKEILLQVEERKRMLSSLNTFPEITWTRYFEESVKKMQHKQIKEACTVPISEIKEFVLSC